MKKEMIKQKDSFLPSLHTNLDKIGRYSNLNSFLTNYFEGFRILLKATELYPASCSLVYFP